MRWKSCTRATVVFAILVTTLALMPAGAWAKPRYKVLYNFQGGKDGAGPIGSLTLDAAGNLYGGLDVWGR